MSLLDTLLTHSQTVSLQSLRGDASRFVADVANVLAKPDAFAWNQAPPLSDRFTAASIVAAYFVCIFALRAFVKFARHGKPLPGSRLVFGVHNFILSACSLVMFAGAAYEVYQRAAREQSMAWFICEDPNTPVQGALYFWSYVYYLSKFYELLDTVFLAAKGSELTFFQIYHHSVVVLMCYLWMHTAQSLQFGGLLFNTFVHVCMYAYFGLTSFDVKPWWRNWITRIQIIQFVTSAFLFVAVSHVMFVQGRTCAGENAMYFNLAFNMSLLFQFIGLAKSGGKKKGGDKTAAAAAAAVTKSD